MTSDAVASVPRRTPKAGRDLPKAIAVGLGLLVLVGASLGFRPEPFVLLAIGAVGAALWELKQAFLRRDIHLPLLPLLVGAAGILVSSYYSGPEALMVSFVLTVAGSWSGGSSTAPAPPPCGTPRRGRSPPPTCRSWPGS
ncbi:hypothetical protein NKG05_01210 [Oerskovia sp. M15]